MREISTIATLFQVWNYGLESIDSGMSYAMLREIGKRIGVLLNFLTQVSDRVLKGPLRGTDRWPNTNNLAREV